MSETLNMDSRFSIAGWSGIAWYLIGYATEWTEESWEWIGEDDDDRDDESLYLYSEPEEVENRQMVRAVMVGDDRVFDVDVDDLTEIHEHDYCSGCGQIGCTADGRDRA